jgi:hypothetical protein
MGKLWALGQGYVVIHFWLRDGSIRPPLVIMRLTFRGLALSGWAACFVAASAFLSDRKRVRYPPVGRRTQIDTG